MSSHDRFSRLIRRWVYRVGRPAGWTPARLTNTVRLAVDECEARVAPAVLPAAVIGDTNVIAGNPASQADEYVGAQLAVHPTNPMRMVAVTASVTGLTGGTTGTPTGGLYAQYSNDGGTTWKPLPGTIPTPPTPQTDFGGDLRDPAARRINPITNQPFQETSSPAVAIERDGWVYTVHLEHDPLKENGVVVVNSWRWSDTDPVPVRDAASAVQNVIYHWVETFDAVLHPTIGLPTGAPTLTDPDTGEVLTNSMVDANGRAKAVYVAWTTNATAPSAGDTTWKDPVTGAVQFNPHAIFTAWTNDRGRNFSSPMAVSTTTAGYNANPATDKASAPRVALGPAGELTFAWTTLPDPAPTDPHGVMWESTSQPDGGIAGNGLTVKYFEQQTPLAITDAKLPVTGTKHDTFNTDSTITLTANDFGPGFTTLGDLDVMVALYHLNLSEVSVSLIAPDGKTEVKLVRNRIQADATTNPNDPNNPFSTGLTNTAHMGIATKSKFEPGTVFDDQAPRFINDAKHAGKTYIGHFRPEIPSLSVLAGKSPTDLAGNWTLRVVDYRANSDLIPPLPPGPPPVPPAKYPIENYQRIAKWGVRFTGGHTNDGFGADQKLSGQSLRSGLDFKGAFDFAHPHKPNFSTTVGIGSGLNLAYDTSGRATGFTTVTATAPNAPQRGKLYAVYTAVPDLVNNKNNSDVFLQWRAPGQTQWNTLDGVNFAPPVRVNDDSLADNFSEGTRPQFDPSVAVDPVTGAVSVMWYDARNDASGTRFAVYVATSMDGGLTFNKQVSITPPKTARDAITNAIVTLEPGAANLEAAGKLGFGVQTSALAAGGGKLAAVWIGNDNDKNSLLYAANARLPAGPQIIDADMGPIVGDAKAGAITYNNTFELDGTRKLHGFRVVFDRPIDPRSFTKEDVEVRFLEPGKAPNQTTPVSVKAVIPVNGTKTVTTLAAETIPVDATTFFVEFDTPQGKVGAYSYAVRPDVHDFVRNAGGYRLVTPTGAYAAPFTKVDGNPIPDDGSLTSIITTPNTLPFGQVVGDVRVRVNINHPNAQDLTLYLTSPSGTKVLLASGLGGTADNYTDTWFDDAALVQIASKVGTPAAPFTGTFRPVEPLAHLAGGPADGNWVLTVEDADGKTNTLGGTLIDWSLAVLPAVKNTPTAAGVARGAYMDQDGDARSGEPAGLVRGSNDVFAVPRPTTGNPFELPYARTTLPLIVPGPNLRPDTATEDNVTVGGQAKSIDNLVLNADAKTIDVTFDRLMHVATLPTDTGSFTAADIIRLTGPAGVIHDPASGKNAGITVAPVYPGVALPGTPTKTFRITFPDALAATFISGQYSIEVGSDIRSAAGHKLDNNLNAGLYNLYGGDPSADPATLADTASYDTKDANGGFAPVTIPRYGSVSFPLGIIDDYLIRQTTGKAKTDPHIQVRMSITHEASGSLQADLVSPDGFRIRLFSGIGTPTVPLRGFTGVLDDTATLPIQGVSSELPTEPFTPQFPLSPLAGRSSKGQWRLEIRDTRTGTDTTVPEGTLNWWGLTFPFSNPAVVTQGEAHPLTPTTPVNTSTEPSGLGELQSDRAAIGFRVFNLDPSDPGTRQVWTPVGPTSINGQTNPFNNAGRVSAVAVDPADPSGNTVYIGVPGGGIWRTTNFLTTSPIGPTWIPLADFGPTNGLNVVSITLVPRKANVSDPGFDPNLTAIYALTGDARSVRDAPNAEAEVPRFNGPPPDDVENTTPGIGVLRSEDGGRTWSVLDSTINVDADGKPLPIDSPQRNRMFFGARGIKIVADPRPSPLGRPLVYMGIDWTNAYYDIFDPRPGIWRSRDGGDTWEQMDFRPAVDLLLAPGSAGVTENLSILYAALRQVPAATVGVYMSPDAPVDIVLDPLAGGQGNGLLRDVGFLPGTQNSAVAVAPPSDTPFGTSTRLTFAAPPLGDNPLHNQLYAGWLYALGADALGNFRGLFLTKDFGRNWTEVRLPWISDTPLTNPNNPRSTKAFGTNDETRLDYDPFNPRPSPIPGVGADGIPRPAEGNYAMSLAVDPQNPNIVYLGGLGSTNGRPQPLAGSLRIDVTAVNDPYSFVFWDNTHKADVNVIQSLTTGGAIERTTSKQPADTHPQFPAFGTDGALYLPEATAANPGFYMDERGRYQDFLNLVRDPNNPFLNPSTLRAANVLSLTNDGFNAKYRPYTEILAGANDVAQIVPYADPLTGKSRLIYATDHGVFTGVDDGAGAVINNVGFAPSIRNSRNGNLQIAQFVSGAVQPTLVAADIAGALFYGSARDNGFPVSKRDILSTGDLNWNNPITDVNGRFDPSGAGVAVDATGSGTAYQYRWPGTPGPGTQQPSDFFRVLPPNTDHSGPGVSRTTGLIQITDDPSINKGQWPLGDDRPVGFFAVNPHDSKGITIASATGQVFRTIDQGLNWFSIGSISGALEYWTLTSPTIFSPDGKPMVDKTKSVTALAYGAPATKTADKNAFVYVGSQLGRISITYDPINNKFSGTSPFMDISYGLDGWPIEEIVANPAHGSREAFAITRGGVYYLDDAELAVKNLSRWKLINGNLGNLSRPVFGESAAKGTVTNGLVWPRALTVDWRKRIPNDPDNPNSPTFPTVYVGGEGGVFRSVRVDAVNPQNTEWALFPNMANEGSPVDGGYLPNAKIVDLDLAIGKFDPATATYLPDSSPNLLVATTFGRGAFAIRLPADQAPGPRVISLTNPTASNSKLQIRFDREMAPNSFSPADVLIEGPSGPVTVTKVYSAAPQVPGQPDPRDKFWIEFDAQPAAGQYKVQVGPVVTDIAGNLMNQDGDATNGEDPDDKFIQFVYLNGLAQSLVVTGFPAQTIAGTPVTFTVTAMDNQGNVNTAYTGTVTITISDPQGSVTPTSWNFTPLDQGKHQFTVTFVTAPTGSQFQYIEATGTGVPAVNPGKGGTTVIGAAPVGLGFYGPFPSPVTAGDAKTFTIAAFDKYGNVSPSYAGSVSFTSTDTKPTTALPGPYTFTAADAGKHTFTATLTTAGTQAITAKDVASGFAATQTGITVVAQKAVAMSVTGIPAQVTAGKAQPFTLAAVDPYGNTDKAFTGVVNIATTDPQAIVPSSYNFTPADAGDVVLAVEFRKAGQKSLTATPAAGSVLAGSAQTVVVAAPATHFAVAGFPSPVGAGDPRQFSVTALDPFDNTDTGYAGKVRFTSTDKQAALPPDAGLTNGAGQFTAILKTAGLQTLTATDTANGAVTGSQTGIDVRPAAASGLYITGLPGTTPAGQFNKFTVTAKDVFGNVAPSFAGAIQFASTDPQAVLPPAYTFTAADNGVHTFDPGVQFKTAGPRNISVSAPNAVGVSPGFGSTTVQPGPAASFAVTPLPPSLGAGEAATFTVTVKDEFGNVVTGYNGTIRFASSDPQATLPADHTFGGTEAGTKTFPVTFRTAGPQTVTVSAAGVAGSPVTLSTTVRPGLATRFEVSGGPPAITAGGNVTVSITARDAFGNVATGYAGAVRFTSTDEQGTMPPVSPLSAGVGTFTATLRTAGAHTVTAAATSDPALSGVVPVTVTAAEANRFELTGITGPVAAGSPVTVSVTARDPFGNTAAGYAGTVRFTSSDPQATLPPAAGLTNGVGQFPVTFRSVGSHVLTATDTANGAVTGALSGITVVPPPPPPNFPPSVSDIADRAIRLNQNTGPIPFTIRDDQTSPDGLTVTALTSNSVLIPLSGIVFGGAGGNRTVAVTPAPGRSGTATITVVVTDAGGLTAADTFTLRVDPFTGPQPPTLIGNEQFAVGTDVGGAPSARLFNPDRTERLAMNVFDPAFSGGVRTATGDFTGDGIADLVVGTGPGIATFVRVIDGQTQAELFNITPFETSFTGGVYVAAGDLNGDGVAELVITPDEGGGPRVRLFDGATFTQVFDFYGIEDPDFRGGARAAIGDLNGDRVGDLAVAAGFQGGPRVAAYDGRELYRTNQVHLFGDFFAFEQTLRNGVFVAVGDLDGDGIGELIAGGGPGGGPRVTAFSGRELLENRHVPVANFFGGDPANRGGVRLAVKDLDDDNRADLVVGDGAGAGVRVTAYLGKNISPAGTPPEEFDFDAFTRFTGGVFVG